MEVSEQLRIIEALVVGSREPLPAARIAAIVPGCDVSEMPACIEQLNALYEEQGRAFEIWEVAGGYQLRTRPVYAGYLQQLHTERSLRLSRAALETLAVVAYKQPATRAEIEHVRGVDVGAVLRSLVERRLVRVVGHREVPGRPMIYGTSRRFLELFGLDSLRDLPTLREIEELVTQDEDEDRSASTSGSDPGPGREVTELAEAPVGGAAVAETSSELLH